MEKSHRKIIYTIGHSTHDFEDFVQMLQSFEIKNLADIRRFPGSRKYPHFNADFMAVELPKFEMNYIPIIELGGRRKPNPDSKNTAWRNAQFQAYADYMETESFFNAMNELQSIALDAPTAYMCSEAVWWRCHRSMVSDWLKANDWTVLHIMGTGKADEHPYTSPACVINGQLTYESKSKSKNNDSKV